MCNVSQAKVFPVRVVRVYYKRYKANLSRLMVYVWLAIQSLAVRRVNLENCASSTSGEYMLSISMLVDSN
jgi:hypothetical protein